MTELAKQMDQVEAAMKPGYAYSAAVLSARLGFPTVPALEALFKAGRVIVRGARRDGIRIYKREATVESSIELYEATSKSKIVLKILNGRVVEASSAEPQRYVGLTQKQARVEARYYPIV